MAKLYTLTEKYRAFNQFIDDVWDNEGLTEDDMQMYIETLESIEDEISVKTENIVKLLKNIDSDIKALKDEEERLTKKRKALQNKHDNIKNYMKTMLESSDKNTVNAGLFKVRLQKSNPSLNVIDATLIPDTYKIAQDPKIDSKGILAAVKNGEKIDGVQLITDKKHLVIS
ncbi:siphovirus Gp157 family protein [Paenibacillus sp. JSM ZJ436]|uniref:siphovirus Gp157 family protein n=1 Tax=Paenibacillus sp. JSM ZJ436 TaxID=3376190 RepID=UPI00379B2BA0